MPFEIFRDAEAFSRDPSDKRQKRIEDEAHLAFVRRLPSVISGAYGCEAAHIRFGDPRHRKKKCGMGRKPDDAHTLPLTSAEHRDQHSGNEKDWWANQGYDDPVGLAERIYHASPDYDSAVAIIMDARQQRLAKRLSA